MFQVYMQCHLESDVLITLHSTSKSLECQQVLCGSLCAQSLHLQLPQRRISGAVSHEAEHVTNAIQVAPQQKLSLYERKMQWRLLEVSKLPAAR